MLGWFSPVVAFLTFALIATVNISPPLEASGASKSRRSGRAEVQASHVHQPAGPRSRVSQRSGLNQASYKVMKVRNGGTISGIVLYKGDVPTPRKIQVNKDHESCGHHPTEAHLIRVNGDGEVAEAVVYLLNIPSGKDWPKDEAKSMIDQKGCQFLPHVQIIRVKAPFEIINSDPVAHNINAAQRYFTLFNILQPKQGMKTAQQFDQPGLVSVKCNMHDWMQAYVHVAAHPYIVKTGDDGSFTLSDVPSGSYQVGVWQEYLGEQVFQVSVKPDETSSMKIELKQKIVEGGRPALNNE